MNTDNLHPVLVRLAKGATPVRTAFVGSIFLSLVALQQGVINRDGMLYVDAARIFLDQGFNATFEVFQWPFMSMLMAILSQLSGLGLETAGHALNVVFMAGTCALLVACAGRVFPEVLWPICLVVLSVPTFNGYRDELLREYGAWFFLMLAVWLSLRWSERPSWGWAFVIQGCIFAAALFRPEAIAYLAAIVLWRFSVVSAKEWGRQSLMLTWSVLLGVTVLFALHMGGDMVAGRLVSELRRFELLGFQQKSAALASALIVHAKDLAPTILVIGSLGLVPLKYMMKLGLFLIPLMYALFARREELPLARCGVFLWLFVVHGLMLAIFVLDLQFLAGRYVVPLIMFSCPVIGYGLAGLMLRFPRWKRLVVTVALLVMVGNVVSVGSGKFHHVEAGRWLAQNVTDSSRVYIESGRAAYHAGWRYATNRVPMDRVQLKAELSAGSYEMAVFEVPKNDADFTRWLDSTNMTEIRRFSNENGESVRVAVPKK